MTRLNNDNWVILILIIALITEFSLLILVYGKSKESISLANSNSKALIETQREYEIRNEATIKIMSKQWELEGAFIKENLQIIDMNNQILSLDSLIETKKELLILRFFPNSCEDCQIQELKLIQKHINKNKAIAIASSKSLRDLMIYFESNGISVPVYQLAHTEIMLHDYDERIDRVFCFLTDNSRRINQVHIGAVGFPDYSENYYKLISKDIN